MEVNLKNGIKILDPFLKEYGFELYSYEKTEDWRNLFAIATYKNKTKEFIVKHLHPIGQVFYKFDKLKIHHNFYLDKLGFKNKKKFINFWDEDFRFGGLQKKKKWNEDVNAFTNILYDFDFLIIDFFEGECIKLKEFSKLYNKTIIDYNTEAHEDFSEHFDSLKIKTAKEAYNKKELKKCLDIYKKVENKQLLNAADKKILEYCDKYNF